MHDPGTYYRKKMVWDFNWISRRMYRGMSYVPPLSYGGNNGSVSIFRSAVVNAINFTLYEGVRKRITAWERESSDSIGQ
jgi:hypothetical protein